MTGLVQRQHAIQQSLALQSQPVGNVQLSETAEWIFSYTRAFPSPCWQLALGTAAPLPRPQWQQECKPCPQGLQGDPLPVAEAALAPQALAPWRLRTDFPFPMMYRIIVRKKYSSRGASARGDDEEDWDEKCLSFFTRHPGRKMAALPFPVTESSLPLLPTALTPHLLLL